MLVLLFLPPKVYGGIFMTKKAMTLVKILAIVAIVVLAMSLVLVGCDKLKDAGKPEAEVGNKEITLIIGVGEEYATVVVKTYQEYMAGLLLELKLRGKIEYESSQGAYGTFVESLNNIRPASASEWVAVYHDIDDVTLRADIGEWPMANAEYNGKTYFSSSVGVDSLPLRNGHTYYFTLGTM